jgi:hypothetical protein
MGTRVSPCPKVVEAVRRLFFTKVTGERIKERGTDGLKAAMKNYTFINPPKPIDSVQQGGMMVYKGQGLTFVPCSAQLERFLWDRGCA